MAHAKNLAHRLGIMEGADVLVNLDADNFTGHGFAAYLNEVFQEDRVYCWSRMIKGQGNRGISGRIAVTRNAFLTTGGYDERFEKWGPDDKDFTRRLQKLGYADREIDRRFLRAIPHTDEVRFEAYPEIKDKVDEQEEEFSLAATPTNPIANAGRVGCGVVYRDRTPIEIGPIATRVFGIGMHKTATCSLHAAFKLLGYDSAHWTGPRWARDIWTEMIVQGSSPTLERHYALCDLPISILYRELDRAYPGSKFILSVRNESDWLASVRRHWQPEANQFRASWEQDCFSHRMHEIVYGRRDFDADTMLARYRRHNAEVKAYFAGRKDLLAVDFTKDAGWHELCGFLREPLPNVPFPCENETRANPV